MHAVFEQMLTPKRNRLLIKITGWSRIGFLDEIFPDARFIHIVRDGRAVASSLLHVDLHGAAGTGPTAGATGCCRRRTRRPGKPASGRSSRWRASSGRSSRGRSRRRGRRSTRRGTSQVKYENFCEQPLETCRRVLDFAELESPAGFIRDVEQTTIHDMTQRWRKDLSPEQQALLTDVLREELVRYGYEV